MKKQFKDCYRRSDNVFGKARRIFPEKGVLVRTLSKGSD